jgi:small conductance mechanosensitive channel
MNWDSFWKSFGNFFETDAWWNLVAIVSIIVVAFVLRFVLHIVIERVVQQIVSGVKKTQKVEDTQALFASPLAAVRVVQRTRTLGSVLTNIVNVIIFVVAVLLIIDRLSPTVLSSFALLTAAIGAGLGFGAQNIVKDALNGLFMVMEDQLGVGDIVDLGPATGVVEGVGVRITQVRDVNGTLWFVRNGEILRVGNMSHGWARVIIDLAIPYDADVDAVQAEMLRVAIDLASSSKWRSRVLEKPEIWGLESISAEALVIRLVVKTRTSAKDDVARELRMRLKKAVDDMGITLPSLNSIVLTGFDGAASVQGARPPRTAPVGVVEAPAKAPRKVRNLAPRIRKPKNAAAPAPAPKVAEPRSTEPKSTGPKSTAPKTPAPPKDSGEKSAATKDAEMLEAEAQVTEKDASYVK